LRRNILPVVLEKDYFYQLAPEEEYSYLLFPEEE
jgi:hypothetical protein